jgi:N-acetylmuramoyl-L-alanine amidase
MQRTLRWTAALVVLLLPAFAARARVHRSRTWADTQFGAAQHLQQALEARPTGERTRRDYDRVIDAYRRVYLGAPSSGRADPSVVAAAQMQEEMGRRFNDPDVLRSAIRQYEFLRREYPGSKFRFDALFHIGEIYKDDLRDKTRADAAFTEFLRRYPRNQFAAAARQALAEPAPQQASLKSRDASKSVSQDSKEISDSDSDDDDAAQENSSKENGTASEAASRKPSRVLGIRHWSTPDYTRVAIDLEQGVRFESQRIDHPDRVFFDLLNTRLDSKLAGKTFDVSDGLLKDVRASQFKTGRTRVVLDLDELSEFDASLLANPPRLIIDIRKTDIRKTDIGKADIHKTDIPKAPAAHEPALETQTAEDDPPSNHDAPNSIATANESLSPQPVAEKPARHNSVVISNGVKKTIVDDDDQPTDTDKVARLDSPVLDPTEIERGKLRPANKVPDVPVLSDRPQNSSRKSKRKTPTTDLDVREAQPTANGDRSLIRALGLKIGKIVIDPGHGGHDTGTIGPNGLEEKDLVLDVSRRLGKLLQTRLGAEVIYTRKDDTFIPLETRTAIANQESADLFVSVHANSSHDSDARGVETYYLNFTSSPEALEVAARENAVSEKSIHELQDLVKKIALKEKIEESHEFASDVQHSLHSGLAAKNPGLRDRGVKKAPFIVLIGANMPSILAEISFVSNPGDERRLGTSDYRQKIAESLYRGIAKYVSGLSGVKVASKIDKDQGQ